MTSIERSRGLADYVLSSLVTTTLNFEKDMKHENALIPMKGPMKVQSLLFHGNALWIEVNEMV